MRWLSFVPFLLCSFLLLADGHAHKRRVHRLRPLHSTPLRRAEAAERNAGSDPWYPLASSDWIPRVVQVIRYDLQLEVNFPFSNYTGQQDFSFNGLLNMTVLVTKHTEFIPLRVQNLTLLSATLQRNGSPAPISSLHVDQNTTHAKLIPVDLLMVGDVYSLVVNYTGKMADWRQGEGDDGFMGLVYDQYFPDQTRDDPLYGVYTFLVPSAARKVFPSVDDPDFKSIFSLSLLHPQGSKAVSNAVALSSGPFNGQKTITRFADTQLTPTFLFAFAVGDYAMSLNQKSGVDVQAISYVQMAPTLEYAANVTAQCIQSMVALTKTPFPLNKLDIVGLIESGFRNPMDNFGLLTADSAEFGSSNFADNYDLAGQSVITCEGVAGQYFGGLVTPERWGSEWLNIGISTYFAGVAARDQLAPADENILEAFVISERGSAFEEMNYTGAPIVYNESRFDGVVQLGGSIVMRMLEGVVERQVFQQAIASYLDDNQWGNARESDFFRAFETANGNQPLCGDLWITDFLWDFLYQSYFPVVKISFDPTAGYSFTQNSINADDTSTWNIPLFVWSEKTQKVKILWLLKDGGTCGSIQWDLDDRYIFNHRSRTFALFDYSLALWGRLLSIDYSVIDEVTQLGMIIDRQISEQFPRAPLPDSSILGRLLNKILNDNYLVVSPFVVDYALMLFENDTLEDQLFELVNWSPATMRQDMINDFLLINAVMDDFADHRLVGQELFSQFMAACPDVSQTENCNPITPNVRGAAYCAGVIDGNQTAVDYFNAYRQFVFSVVDYKRYFEYELFYIEDAEFNCLNTS